MGKRKSIFQFLGERLNDKDLVEKGSDLKLGDIISNAVPKSKRPLTSLTTQNNLDAILEISKKSKLGAEKKKSVKKVGMKSAVKSTKTKSRPKAKAKVSKTKKRK